MEIKIDTTFQRDTRRIKDRAVRHRIANTIESVQRAKSFQEIKNLKKLGGTKSMYRIRIQDYRLGIQIEGNTVVFIRCLHRKDIYKFFP